MKNKIIWCVLISLLLVLASCSSTPITTPIAPDFNTLRNLQDMRFVGEWEANSYYYIFNADGTCTQEYALNSGERVASAYFRWKTTRKWLSLLDPSNGTEMTRPYVFSDDEQTVTFEDSWQKNGFTTGTGIWTKR